MHCARTRGSDRPWTAPTALFDPPGVTQMYQLLVQLALRGRIQQLGHKVILLYWYHPASVKRDPKGIVNTIQNLYTLQELAVAVGSGTGSAKIWVLAIFEKLVRLAEPYAPYAQGGCRTRPFGRLALYPAQWTGDTSSAQRTRANR